jgi:antitoxin MazE
VKTKVQKWGNSLALRIPKAFATEVGLSNETAVEISVKDRKIVVVPLARSAWTLEQLLKGVTKKNIHAETDTGPAQGNEAW